MDERERIQALLYPWVSLSAISALFQSAIHGPWEKVGAPLRPVLVRYHGESLAIGWFPDRGEVLWLDDTEACSIHRAIAFRFRSYKAGLRFFTQGWLNPWSMTAWGRIRSWARMMALLLFIKEQTGPSGWESLRTDQRISRIRINLIAAAAGVSGLAQLDPFSRQIIEDAPDGRLEIRIKGQEEVLALLDKEAERLHYADLDSVPEGPHRAILEFSDAQTAWKSILGEEDHLAAVGEGRIKLSGFIPLADGFGHFVDRLQWYVNPIAK